MNILDIFKKTRIYSIKKLYSIKLSFQLGNHSVVLGVR